MQDLLELLVGFLIGEVGDGRRWVRLGQAFGSSLMGQIVVRLLAGCELRSDMWFRRRLSIPDGVVRDEMTGQWGRHGRTESTATKQ